MTGRVLHCSCVWTGKYRINRRFYAQKKYISAAKGDEAKGGVDQGFKQARFIGLPGMLVFPSALTLAFNFFVSGLINNAVRHHVTSTSPPLDGGSTVPRARSLAASVWLGGSRSDVRGWHSSPLGRCGC